MMPFSVLRVWTLGLWSWFLLGTGIYLATLSYQEFRDTRHPAVHLDRQTGDRRLEPSESVQSQRDSQRFWVLVGATVICLSACWFGYVPVTLLLGKPGNSAGHKKPTSLTVKRPDGTQLNVEVYGGPGQPTILLTHGWSLDTSAWDYMMSALAKRFRIVAWDLPGLGRSKGPSDADFSLEKMAHDLEAVREATATKDQLFLVGHSIGGMIQQTYCRLYPERLKGTVDGLVLLHTTYTNPVRTNLVKTLLTVLEKPVLVPLNYLTIALAPLAWLSNWQSYLNGSLHISTRITSFSGKQTRQQLDHAARLLVNAWPATVARGSLAMSKFDEQPTLPEIVIPALVIVGEADRLTLPDAGQHIEHSIPNSRLLRVPTGHFGHWELSDVVAEGISEFVDHLAADSHSKREHAAKRG